jgi:hypothetical protein
MQTKTIFIILGVVGVCLILCVGCGGIAFFFGIGRVRDAADRQQRMNDLKQVVLAAHSFHNMNRRMPANANELQGSFLPPGSASNRLRSGEIEMVWNALPFGQQPQGTSGVIYAWDTKPAGNGMRLVGFMDGMADQISESDFLNKPKAATKMTKQ